MAKASRSIELQPDAWERFERAVNVVAKSPPLHRKKQKSAAGVEKAARINRGGRRPPKKR
jgi:hypothetical protein